MDINTDPEAVMLDFNAEQDLFEWKSRETLEDRFLTGVISNDLIHTIIFNNCAARALCRIAMTCRTCNLAVKSYFKVAFNINKLLSRFFPNPLAFRSLQASTATLISGSQALQFFDRSFYKESDLDIYVPLKFRERVGLWLLGVGYKFVPGKKQQADFKEAVRDPKVVQNRASYFMRGVAAVFTFVKPSPSDANVELKVQVIVAARTAMEIILNFHSTCVMNVISYNKAFSLYPLGTLAQRQSLKCATDGPNQEPAIEKYETRGWKMITNIDPKLPGSQAFATKARYVGDSHCWTVPLNTQGVKPPTGWTRRSTPFTRDPVEASNWVLADLSPQSGLIGGAMCFKVMSHPKLFLYQYATHPDDLGVILSGKAMLGKQNLRWTDDKLLFEERQFFDAEYVEHSVAYLKSYGGPDIHELSGFKLFAPDGNE